MKKITVALDWAPNTNHAGIYLAQQQGLYAAAGLEVRIVSPETDNYATTPARKLVGGQADLAIASSETVLSYRTAAVPLAVTAVAALLQHDTSAIATLATSGIERPAQLDGRVYASYQARFEDHIVREMVKADGGQGSLVLTYPAKLDIWQQLLRGEADATWIFMGWEGAQAALDHVGLRTFAMAQYGIPYGYTPVMVSTAALIEAKKDVFKQFLALTETGYRFAAANAALAAQTLRDTALPAFANQALIERSLTILQPHFLDAAGQWGRMEITKWAAFVQWLVDNNLLQTNAHTAPEQLFVNL